MVPADTDESSRFGDHQIGYLFLPLQLSLLPVMQALSFMLDRTAGMGLSCLSFENRKRCFSVFYRIIEDSYSMSTECMAVCRRG